MFENPNGKPEGYETHLSRLAFEMKSLRRVLRIVERYDAYFDDENLEELSEDLQWLLKMIQLKFNEAKIKKAEKEQEDAP